MSIRAASRREETAEVSTRTASKMEDMPVLSIEAASVTDDKPEVSIKTDNRREGKTHQRWASLQPLEEKKQQKLA
jgi:hypothetical protein